MLILFGNSSIDGTSKLSLFFFGHFYTMEIYDYNHLPPINFKKSKRLYISHSVDNILRNLTGMVLSTSLFI